MSRHPSARPGEQNGSAVLAVADVVAIRRRVADGASQRSLARQFCMSDSQVSAIVTGRSWPDAGGQIRKPRSRAECMAAASRVPKKRRARPEKLSEAQRSVVAAAIARGYDIRDADRFASHVAIGGDGGCWLWTGSPDGRGYGRIKNAGTSMLAHRVSYEMLVGPIPDGLDALHTCDVCLCVAPHHLYLGTDIENSRDRVERERQSRGEKHASAKLTESQVVVVRERAATGESGSVIAADMGVSRATIGSIARGATWKHVGGPRTSHKILIQRLEA